MTFAEKKDAKLVKHHIFRSRDKEYGFSILYAIIMDITSDIIYIFFVIVSITLTIKTIGFTFKKILLKVRDSPMYSRIEF